MPAKLSEGMYLVDKPTGLTSFDVVKLIRQVSDISKVGHAGTLDPLASGLMIILVGKEWTKKAASYLKLDKSYEVEMKLGYVSTTSDAEGQLSPVSNKKPTESEVIKTIEQFIGTISQKPPIFSAIKIKGQPAYKRARKGETVNIPERLVKIYSIKKVQYEYPIIRFKAMVSSGTYIRSLVEDIGKTLGTGAYTLNLRRTKIGDCEIKDAIKISSLKNFR